MRLLEDNLKKYAHILFVYWRQSLSKFLIFRASGLIGILYSLVYLVGSFLSVKVYFKHSHSIGSVTEGEMLILLGAFQLMTGVFEILFLWAQDSVVADILEGNLDIHLLRPANSLFLICTKEFYIPGIVNLFVPCLLIWQGLEQSALNPSALEWLLFSLSVGIGSAIMFLLTQIVLNLAFWIEGYSSLWVIADEVIKLGSRPLQIYVQSFRVMFGAVIPVVTALNLPAEILRGYLDISNVLLTFALFIVLYFITKQQFKRGLRRYQSASS